MKSETALETLAISVLWMQIALQMFASLILLLAMDLVDVHAMRKHEKDVKMAFSVRHQKRLVWRLERSFR
jgi:hypothetical protein